MAVIISNYYNMPNLILLLIIYNTYPKFMILLIWNYNMGLFFISVDVNVDGKPINLEICDTAGVVI